MEKILLLVLLGMVCVLGTGTAYRVEAAEGEQLYFDAQGNLHMTTHDRIATSPITYKTIGWMLKQYDMPFGEPGNRCVVVVLEDDGLPQVDPENPAYQYCHFLSDKTEIFNAIGAVSKEWQHQLYSSGGTVYMDAIMTVCYNGVPQGGLNPDHSSYGRVYITYDGIAHAEAWADRTVLQSHYDKQVYFPGNPQLLTPVCPYEVAYYECFEENTDVWPLSRYQKDYRGEWVQEQDLEVQAENLSAHGFFYVSAQITKVYQDGTGIVQRLDRTNVLIDKEEENLQSVRIVFYYRRGEQVSYLKDCFHMKENEIVHEAEGTIGAGDVGEEPFDVAKGIPTGENLYVSGQANRLAYQVTYEKHSGYVTRQVQVISHYTLCWTKEDGTQAVENVQVSEMYYVDVPYSYWRIEQLELYTLKHVTVSNYAFEGEKVRLENVYHPNIKVEECTSYKEFGEIPQIVREGGVVYGDGSRPELPAGGCQSEAEQGVDKIVVRNDTFAVDGEVFLDGESQFLYAKEPKIGSESGSQNFCRIGCQIPDTKRNGRNYPSKIVVEYEPYRITGLKTGESGKINTVTIHTPVVCRGFVTDERCYNQLCRPDEQRKTLILGRNFGLTISAQGQHLEQKGYGEKDYGTYVLDYGVRFPFPVYEGETYYPAERWISCGSETEFYLPTGVEEGNYEIHIRTLALNYTEGDELGNYANYMLSDYGAEDTLAVQVCGRLYGLQIHHITGERWRPVYENGPCFFTVGLHNLNGERVRDQVHQTVPILAGGNPLYPDEEGSPLGTTFSYQLETIGDYGEEDGLWIEPEYYVVGTDGGSRQRVELYYFSFNGIKEHWEKLIDCEESGRRFLGINDRKNIGDTDRNVEDIEKAVFSVQRYQGRFQIPEDVFVVPYGTDVEQYIKERGSIAVTDEMFIRKGYLMVQFRIYTQKKDKRHLSYINEENEPFGYANMWRIEGFENPKKTLDGREFYLECGDVFLYDLERGLEQEHEVMGTH